MRRRALVLVVVSSGLSLLASAARADVPLAEPVIEENITDIESREAGTLELDTTHTMVHARNNANGVWRSTLEAEWRPFGRLGVGGDLGYGGTMNGASLRDPALSARGTLSYAFLQDFERMLFLQAESSARHPEGYSLALADLTESALPYTAGVRSALLVRSFTLRAAVFVEGGGPSAHAPVRTSWAALYGIAIGSSVFYVGSEAVADWAQRSPFAVAPEVLAVVPIGRRNVRFGLAFPTSVGAVSEQSSFGVSLRVVLEPDD